MFHMRSEPGMLNTTFVTAYVKRFVEIVLTTNADNTLKYVAIIFSFDIKQSL
jgi:hypothetical protein